MNSYDILPTPSHEGSKTIVLDGVNSYDILPTLSHEFRVRTHEGSKTIVQDGVKKKISVVRVFWSMVEGDYVYGKKRIITSSC